MIALSDNTAANLSMDHVGIKNVDDRLVSLGLKNTWLYREVFKPATGPMPADQKQFGLGKTTAREMAELMQRFATCNLGPAPAAGAGVPTDKELCSTALHMLKVQFYRDSIPRYLEGDDPPAGITDIANKTGALNHVRNDVGAVFTKHGTIVISAFTHDNADTSWTVDNQAEVLMAHLTRAVIDSWSSRTNKTMISSGCGRSGYEIRTFAADCFPRLCGRLVYGQTAPTFRYNSGKSSLTLPGHDPAQGGTTVIPTVLVPVRLEFDAAPGASKLRTLDAAGDVRRVLRSPVFSKAAFGPKETTQYVDAMLRATTGTAGRMAHAARQARSPSRDRQNSSGLWLHAHIEADRHPPRHGGPRVCAAGHL